MPPSELTAILLAGGLGNRIRRLHPDVPKPMIPVADRPFLEWLIRYWIREGVRRFIISAGYGAESVQRFVDAWPASSVSLHAVREPEPLGTGGAIRYTAATPSCSDPFIVANGDSLVMADLATAWSALDQPQLDGLIVAVEAEDASRYGLVEAASDDVLLGFHEKRAGRGFINAGIYVLKRRLLDLFPTTTPLSMETEVFPALLRQGARIKVVRVKVPFLDIGTPESLALAEDFVRRNVSEMGRLRHESSAHQLL